MEFVTKKDKLYIHPGSGADIELKPESERKFFFADGTDQQIEFETDNSSNLLRVWQIAWGVRKELKKIE